MYTIVNTDGFFPSRERPAAIPIEIKSIDDTSNFDEFPDSDILQPTGAFLVTLDMLTEIRDILWVMYFRTIHYSLTSSILSLSQAPPVSNHTEADLKSKDWVFINYTYKRFEGLTARGGIPSYMKTGKR